MIEAAIISMIQTYVGLMGLLFLLAAAFNHKISWFLLVCGHGVWCGYSLVNNNIEFDYYSLTICLFCILGIHFHDYEIKYEEVDKKILYILLVIAASFVITDSFAQFIDSLAILSTIVGLFLLSIKFIDGWIFLAISSLFNFQSTMTATIFAIVIGILICCFGYYNWNKLHNNIQIYTTDGK